MFDSCLLWNTAASWWGSSIILDKLRIFFLLDSTVEDSWVMFSHVPVMHGKRRMLAQNNHNSQSLPVLSCRRKSLINGKKMSIPGSEEWTPSLLRLFPDLPRAAVMNAWFGCTMVCYEDVKSELDG